jgi:hypothetical protein
MALNFPYLPPNPLRPRAFGGKGAEGMKKEIPSSLSGSHQAKFTGFFAQRKCGALILVSGFFIGTV